MKCYSLSLYDINNELLLPQIELTPKEQNILNLTVKGLMNKEIAKNSSMTTRNVEYYIGRLFNKTKNRSRSELIRYCIQNRINI
uniref:DNA-binding response regulator n=1 Tax=Pulvinaster venetus TaxID=427767 RepID=UPI001FCD532C|nr:DNA-binding response regulator [Pulvinaster venetus]UNJ16953.1 DNA-binding response regulator [Pulvinaster venetus]